MADEKAVNQQERQRWNNEYWTSVWPKREQLTGAVIDFLLDAAALQSGQRVLDVGSGAGIASLRAAARVGPTGRVLGADISAPLVDYATRRAASEGVDQVTFVVRDVQQDGIAEASSDGGAPFDAVISQFGVMFFEDPEAAFANIRAHLAPGGRLAFACWQPADLNPWFVGPAIAPFVTPPPPPASRKSRTGPFAFADPEFVRSILTGAGWSGIERAAHQLDTVVTEDAILDDGQLIFLGVPPASIDDARRAVDAHLAPLRRADGRVNASLAFQIFTARA